MSTSDRQRWDEKYGIKSVPDKLAPDDWLVEQASDLLPGRALELACGLGHNAIWLAQQGWTVDALDISPLGLASAEKLAQTCAVHVNWIAGDIDDFIPKTDAYDLVIVFRFLDRIRLPGIAQQALRPGGQMIYETFTTAHINRPDSHMKNPAFALQPQELPRLFQQLDVISYAECALADRDVARLMATKPGRHNSP